MIPLLNKNFISTKDASILSGYNPDYLGRLCREGKLECVRVGRSWLIAQDSLESFITTQEEKKKEYAEELSKKLEREYNDTKLVPPQKAYSLEDILGTKSNAQKYIVNTVVSPISMRSLTPLQKRGVALIATLFVLVVGVNGMQARFVGPAFDKSFKVAMRTSQDLQASVAMLSPFSSGESFSTVATSSNKTSLTHSIVASITHPLSIPGTIIDTYTKTVYAFVEVTPEIPVRVATGLYKTGSVLADTSLMLPTHIEQSYALGSNVVGEIAYDDFKMVGSASTRVTVKFATLIGNNDVSHPTLAAVQSAHAYTIGEVTALNTYDAIHGFFASTGTFIAGLFGGTTTKAPQIYAIQNSSTHAPAIQSPGTSVASPVPSVNITTSNTVTSASPIYVTGTTGVSEAFVTSYVDGRFVELRELIGKQADALISRGGGNSSSQTTVVQTPVMVGGPSGDITGTSLAISGSTSLAELTADSTTINGDLVVSGNTSIGGTLSANLLSVNGLSSNGVLQAPYFVATSTASTSTFAGAVNFDSGGFAYATTTRTTNIENLNVSGNTILTSLTLGSVNGFLKATAGAISTSLIDLTSDVTGILPIAKGGTGSSSFATNGVLYGNGTNGLLATSQGGPDTVLVANNGAPTFSSAITVGTSVTSPILNATGSFKLNGIDITTGGTLANIAYLDQNNTFTGSTSFNGNTALTNATSTNFFTSVIGLGSSYFNSFLGTGLQNTNGALTVSLSTFSTSDLAEGSNLYFTDERADARINATSTIETLLSAPNLGTINTALNGVVHAASGVLSASLVGLTTDVTGVLPQANGGTGFASYNPGDIFYADLLGNLQLLPAGLNGSVLKLAGGLPSWGADQTIGAGGSDGIFATSTGLIYPVDTPSILLVGTSATSTLSAQLEVAGTAYISSRLAIATTVPGVVTGLAVGGPGYFTGGLGVGTVNTTAGTLRTSGNTSVGGNLGIGTTSPYASLSVDTSAFGSSATGNVLSIGSSTSQLLTVTSGGAFVANGSSFTVNRPGGVTQGLITLNNTGSLSLFAANGQNLNIGASNTTLLSIPGGTGTIQSNNASSFAFLSTTASTNSVPTLIPNRSSTNTGIGGASGTLSLITGGVNALQIDAAQEVGIGSSSPGSLLSVGGNAMFGIGAGSRYLTINSTSGFISGTENGETGARFTLSNNINAVGGGGISFSTSGNPSGAIASVANSTLSFYAGAATAGNEKVRLTSTGFGIGTTSPYAKLSVAGDIALTGGLYDSSATLGTNGQILQTTGTGVQWVSTSTLGFASLTSFSATAPLAYNNTTGAFSITQATTLTDGYLSSTDWNTFNNKQAAITPGNGLTFVGNTLNSVWTANGSSIYNNNAGNIGVGTTTPWGQFSINLDGTTSQIPAFVIGSSTGTSFAVSSSGKVSIGTSTSIADLTIAHTGASNNLILWRNDLAAGRWGVGVGGGGTLTFGQNTSIVGNINNGDVKFYIAPTTGNFAIGTSTVGATIPTAKLFVWGSGTGTGELLHLINNASTTVAKFLDNGTGYFGGSIGIGTTTPWAQLSINPNGIIGPSFAIGSSTSTNFVITNGGNVGIGTSTPYANLSVAGSFALTGSLLDRNASAGTNGYVLQTTGSGTQWVATSSLGFASLTSLSASAPLSYNSNTGAFSISQAGTFSDGYLSSTDWNTFNNKQAAITPGNGLSFAGNTLNSVWTAVGNDIYNNNTGKVGIGTSSPWAQLSINPNGIAGPAIAVGSTTGGTNFLVTNTGRVGIASSTPGYALSVGSMFGVDANGLMYLGYDPWLVYENSQRYLTLQNGNAVGNQDYRASSLIELRAPDTNGTSTDREATYTAEVPISPYGYNGTFDDYTDREFLDVGCENYPKDHSCYVTAGSSGAGSNQAIRIGFWDTDIYSNVEKVPYQNWFDPSGAVALGYASTTSNSANRYDKTIQLQVSSSTATTVFAVDKAPRTHLFQVQGNGNVGVGTSSPFAKVSIHANSGETNKTLFAVSSSTSSATTSLFAILNNGNIGVGTSTPYASLSISGSLALTGSLLDRNASAGTNGYVLQTTGSGTQWVATSSLGFASLGSLSATAPLAYNNTTGAFSIAQASTLTDGYLSSTDWNTFNNKQAAITPGNGLTFAGNTLNSVWTNAGGNIYNNTGTNVGIGTTTPYANLAVSGSFAVTGSFFDKNASAGTNGQVLQTTGAGVQWVSTSTLGFVSLNSFSATAPLQYNNGTGVFSITPATTLVDGYLTSTDWNTFNNKQNALTFGNLTGDANISVSGGTGAVIGSGVTLTLATSTFSGSGSNLNADLLDGLDSTYFIANSFSTTSANAYLATKTTDNLTQGSTNKYYSDALARTAVSSTATGLTYTSANGVFSLTSGYSIPLTASTTDWNTAYLNRVTSASAPLTLSNGVLAINQATTLSDGYLSSTDWNTFNNKQAAITPGNGLTFAGNTLNSVWTATGNDIYNNNSADVGIGSSTPWGQLSVNPNGVAGPAFVIGSSTSTKLIVTNGGNVGIGTTTPYAQFSINPNGLPGPSLVIGSSSNTSLTVNNGGQLSIGTTTAIGLVNLASPGATNQLVLMRNDTGAKWGIGVSGNNTIAFGYNTSLTGNINNSDVKYYADSVGDFVVGTTTAAAAAAGSAKSRLYVWGAGTGNNEIFQLVNNASTTIARFLDNGTGYFGGNIGIGTTSPGQPLSIQSTTANQFAIAYDTTHAANFAVNSAGTLTINPVAQLVLNGTQLNLQVSGNTQWTVPVSTGDLVSSTATGPEIVRAGGGGTTPVFVPNRADLTTGFGSAATGQLTLTTDGIERVRINSTGLGIGSTTPSSRLSVAGASGGTTNLFMVSTSTSGFATTTVARIDSNGNTLLGLGGALVGIGTTSPTAQLDVLGTVRFESFGAGTLQTDASGNLSVSSDERLKNVDGAFTASLAQIKQLTPITYHWNALSGLDQKSDYAGFSAQNVQAAIPAAIGVDPRGYLTLSDRPILAAAINAIKELSSTTDLLSMATTSLDARITALEQKSSSPVSASNTVSVNEFQNLASSTSMLTSQVSDLSTRLANLESMQISTSSLADAMQGVTASTTETSTTTMIIDALQNMGVLIAKGIVQFNTLVARDLVFSKDTDNSSAAGSAVIPAGATSVTVSNDHMLASSLVTLTLTSSVNGASYVSAKENGSFKVFLAQAQHDDVSFDYFIVQTQGQIASSTAVGAANVGSFSFSSWLSSLFGGAAPTSSTSTQTPPPASTPAPTSTPTNTATSTSSVDSPVVTLTGDPAIALSEGDLFTDPGATAVDSEGTDISASIAVSGAVDANTPGMYTLTYTATDAAGHTGAASRVVTVSAIPTVTTATSTLPAPPAVHTSTSTTSTATSTP